MAEAIAGLLRSVPQPRRGSAAFAAHMSVYWRRRRIGLHPAVLCERRGAGVAGGVGSEGLGLFLRDAVDAGAALAVLPASQRVAAATLETCGGSAAFALPPSLAGRAGACAGGGASLVAALVGHPAWPRLAWRLALERCQRSSHFWGWLRTLPEPPADTGGAGPPPAAVAARERLALLRPPAHAAAFSALDARVAAEARAAWAAAARDAPSPPLAAFEWAVRVLLARATVVPSAQGEAVGAAADASDGGAGVELAVLPLLDLALALPPLHSPRGAGGTSVAATAGASCVLEVCGPDGVPPWYWEAHTADAADAALHAAAGSPSNVVRSDAEEARRALARVARNGPNEAVGEATYFVLSTARAMEAGEAATVVRNNAAMDGPESLSEVLAALRDGWLAE